MKSNGRSRAAISLFVLISVSVQGTAFSQMTGDGTMADRWWLKHDEGWYFYHEEPAMQEEEIKEQQQTEAAVFGAPPASSPLSAGQAGAPEPLFTESMKKKGEELLSTAMEKPTTENVKAYMEHNKAMMDISSAFSVVWQKVLMTNPELEASTPASDADKDIYFKVEEEKEREALMKLSQQTGLFFIYSSTCHYCKRMAIRLRQFMYSYPYFTVKAISMDGGILPEFPDSEVDNGITQRLGIDKVPVVLLALPPDRFDPIANSLITGADLKRRLLWYAQETSSNYSHLNANP